MSIKIIPHFCVYFENIDGYPSKSFASPQFCFKCHPKTFGLVLDLLYSFWGQKKGVVAMLEKWDYIPWCPPRFQRLHHFGAEVCLNQQWMSISSFTTRTGSMHLSTINSMVKLVLSTTNWLLANCGPILKRIQPRNFLFYGHLWYIYIIWIWSNWFMGIIWDNIHQM
jgi:hypothetical protein